ncbi:MAG: MATE family efflux transporter [Clostridia bacterium]|nr:MATE family efflux transporter [Clostridia bacterium]
MKISLSDHFTYKKLIRAVLPSIIMMVFTSVYGIVDGIFVSNFAEDGAFAAVNLVMPIIMAIGCLGFMVGTGGSAIVAKTLGEGNKDLAHKIFTMMVIFTVILGMAFSVIGILLIKPLAVLLGATGNTLKYCVNYGTICFAGMTAYMLQCIFQNFCVVAEKAKFGLFISVMAGITNMVLDAVLVGIFNFGIIGAAIATVSSQIVGFIIPLIYFLSKKNNSILRLTKSALQLKPIVNACVNGSSELMSNISSSVVNFCFNLQLMKYVGEAGVEAYGVIMYATFIYAAIYIGYSVGSAPLISYNYGAQNHFELKNLYKKSILIMLVVGITLTLLSEVFAYPLSAIFVGYDKALLNMTTNGMRIFCLSFIMMGINIFGSAFFTALNNGLISAVIAFVRTLVFQLIAVFTLPLIFNNPIDGIWFSVVVGEFASMLLTVLFFITKRKKYKYA